MKKLSVLLMLLWSVAAAMAQSLSSPPSGDNQKAKVSQWIGPVEVSISYSSPDVHSSDGKDRKGHIWGELVAAGFTDQGYGVKEAPWRAGANENTTVSFSHDVKIGGKELKAGTYALFLDYEKSGSSSWIFSKNSTSWGSYFYDAKEDAARVSTTAEDAPYTEWLTYGFEDRQPSSTVAYLQWENKRFSFKVEVPNINELYVSMMRNELRNSQGFDTRNLSAAAQFCADNRINLPEALTWANAAMDPAQGGKEDFSSLRTKADVLTAMGKNDEADVVMEKAIRLPGTPVMAIHQYGKTLLAAGKKEKALAIFQYNLKAHPEEKFTPYVGLARAYAALGDKKNAIKNWEIALKNVPDSQKPYLKVFQEELDKLKK